MIRNMKNRNKDAKTGESALVQNIAGLLGITKQAIIAVENDKYNPTRNLAIKITGLVNVPVETIFHPNA